MSCVSPSHYFELAGFPLRRCYQAMSCSLFVAEVRGSRRCSVCRRDLAAHSPEAIYVQPQRLFDLLPSSSSPLVQGMASTAAGSLAPSENSAFSPYSRPNVSSFSSSSASSSSSGGSAGAAAKATTTSAAGGDAASSPSLHRPPPLLGLIRPQPRHALAALLPRQEDRTDANISKKIRSKRKERPNSVGMIDSLSFGQPIGFRDDDDGDEASSLRESLRSSPLPAQRSNDFKLILQRFQSADKRTPTSAVASSTNNNNNNSGVINNNNNHNYSRTSNHSMSPAHQNPGWSPPHRANSQESWSPAHRSSLNSNYRESPAVSRNTSARSRLSVSSMQSPPHSFLPTRDSSPRSMPSPSLVPLRRRSSPDLVELNERHSPMSHTGSTPEPEGDDQLLVAVGRSDDHLDRRGGHSQRRHSFLQHEIFSSPRWVKETDVDDPNSLPTMSPIDSSGSSDAYPPQTRIVHPVRSAPMSKRPSVDRLDVGVGSPPVNGNSKHGKTGGRYGGSCRRVLSGVDQNSRNNLPSAGPNGVYVRRSRSKDERPSLNSVVAFGATYNQNQHNQSHNPERFKSPLRTNSIPIFLSHESVVQSPLHSPPPPPPPRAFGGGVDVYKHYQQMVLSHMHTLTVVADKLGEAASKGEEPVTRSRLAQLDFSSFVVQSPHPILTKGKSLFYNAVLPRQGLPDYPVTLMIAPCSQYAPLMRKSESNQFGLPGFLEIEDHDGAIKQFLYDTGTQNLDGRNTKVIAMPRLNLCSFHSLAAHQLNQRIDMNLHEELVSFILLQLLSALKMLQGEGVESLSTNFKEFLLAYRYPSADSPSHYNEFPRLLFLPETLGAEIESGGDELVGLCRFALRAQCTLLHHRMDGRVPPIRLRSRFSRALAACALLLQEDKSSSLTKAKNVLELSLWSGGEHFKSEQEARIWIDMARAECIDGLLRQMVCEPTSRMGARERYRVEFLLSATPRAVLESQTAMLGAQIS